MIRLREDDTEGRQASRTGSSLAMNKGRDGGSSRAPGRRGRGMGSGDADAWAEGGAVREGGISSRAGSKDSILHSVNIYAYQVFITLC